MDDLSLEESFPELRMNGLAHVRGKKQRGPILIGSSRIEDPNTKKHGNRKKREKIRRIYTDPAWYLYNYNMCYYWTTWLRNLLRIKQLHNSKSEHEKGGVEIIKLNDHCNLNSWDTKLQILIIWIKVNHKVLMLTMRNLSYN